MENLTETNGQTDHTLSAIDQAAAAARARKDAKKAAAKPASSEVSSETGSKRVSLTPEQRIERTKQTELERATRKATREAARQVEKASKPPASPAHMKKVEKAGAGLPVLTGDAQVVFTEVTSSLPNAELQALAAHLLHHVRVQTTQSALGAEVKEGQTVKVISGGTRYVGRVGTARKPGRIRVLVDFAGSDRPGYFFTSDVTPVEADPTPEPAADELPGEASPDAV